MIKVFYKLLEEAFSYLFPMGVFPLVPDEKNCICC